MLRFRPFRNTDPPLVTSLWRSRGRQPGFFQPVSVDVLEQFLFARLYFDYQGLILAFEGDDVVGFVHAGFGPNAERTWLSRETGVICMIFVRPDTARPTQEIAAALLEQGEEYLRRRGTGDIYGGPAAPWSPFYWGLYGGTKPPGILPSDTVAQELYRSHGYIEIDQTSIFTRDLSSFRPVVDRQQIQLRRQMTLEVQTDPPSRTRWEASTLGDFDLTRFSIGPRGSVRPLASLLLRNMDSMSDTCPGPAAGLLDLAVDPAHRRQGLAYYLMGEVFRLLHRQGLASVEAHTPHTDSAAIGLLRKLGFDETGQASIFRKAFPAW